MLDLHENIHTVSSLRDPLGEEEYGTQAFDSSRQCRLFRRSGQDVVEFSNTDPNHLN
jgi:hypothetical protein